MGQVETILDYYRCFKDRDRDRLVEILVENFKHVSPYGRYEERDSMLDAIWPHVGKTRGSEFQVFGTGPEYMVRYRHEGKTSALLSEWIRFEGERIAQIEVYLGRGAVPEMSDGPGAESG